MDLLELRELEKVKHRNRRNEKFKKRDKARIILKNCFGIKDEWLEDNVVRVSDNLRSCSCDMCVSKRKSKYTKGNNKLTLQEIRNNDLLDYEAFEYF